MALFVRTVRSTAYLLAKLVFFFTLLKRINDFLYNVVGIKVFFIVAIGFRAFSAVLLFFFLQPSYDGVVVAGMDTVVYGACVWLPLV